MQRWVWVLLSLFAVNGWLYCAAYAGEFGGFDIDIGAEKDIFDNWEEEPEGNQESAEPEQKENVSSNGDGGNTSSSNDSTNGGNSSDYSGKNDSNSGNNGNNNNGDNNDGNNNSNNSNKNGNSNNNNSNAGAGLSKTENNDNTGDQAAWELPQTAGSEKNPKENNTGGNTNNSTKRADSKRNTPETVPSVRKDDSKKQEEKSGDSAADKNTSEREITPKEKKTADEKKDDMSQAKITEIPKEENKSDYLKFTALGSVSTGIGMAKTSPEFRFYNSNDENREENEKLDKNNNINNNTNNAVWFEHAETVPVNEYPEIKVIRTLEEQDITILSLNLNDEEVFWHQEGDILILEQSIREKKNTVKLIAVIDGRRIVQMPVWEF